jgi:hypothetical protein
MPGSGIIVRQDGLQFNATDVFNDLIAKGQMTVTIGVFVMHGPVTSGSAAALDRFNRNCENDGLGNAHAQKPAAPRL